MAEAPANSALERLIDLRTEVEARLRENPDYKAFVALNRAIAEIGGEVLPDIGEFPARAPTPVKEANSIDVSKMTQPDATHALLTKVFREPMPTVNLVKALLAHGIEVGGVNPNINLSSVLSKDGRFRSVRYKDRSSWWVKGSPFPGELDAR